MNIVLLHAGVDAEADRLVRVLSGAGHLCHVFASAKSFVEQRETPKFDLLLLDGALHDGGKALATARERAGAGLPVLLLTGASDSGAIVSALDGGVDDYLIKPLRERDLLARVSVLLQRAWPERRAQARLSYGAIAFDTLSGQVTLGGKPVAMTQKEYALALRLFRHLGQPLSRATLMETLWSQEADAPSRTLDTHISRVRTKLALNGSGGFRLAPVYAYGYVLETTIPPA